VHDAQRFSMVEENVLRAVLQDPLQQRARQTLSGKVARRVPLHVFTHTPVLRLVEARHAG
jgi:hypothetical protein